MAEDVATITARLKTQYPTLSASIDGASVTLGAAAYDARIAEMASAIRQQQLDAEADAARVLLRKKYRAWQTHKASWATEYARPVGTTLASALARLQATRDAFNVLVGDMDAVIEVLKDSGLVLDD
jgi:CTP:molybdopterin cytidylyltransferase MocA